VTEPETAVDVSEAPEVAKPTDDEPTTEAETTEVPTTPTTPAPAEASPQPEEIVEEELPREEPKEPGPRPPIVRLRVFQAKKPALMDLCRAYSLDPTGTKEQLRARLLSYRDTVEAEAEPEPIAKSEAPARPAPIERPEVEGESVHTPDDVAETPSVVEELESEQPASASPVAETPVETHATREAVAERIEVPSFVSIPESQPAVSVAPAVEPMRALHPCPTCGRELTYIARYRRWYCYHCRAYAPASESRFACPTCGAALRWIGQYERWWCDSCRRYAPADLPKPESAAVVTATPAEAARPLSYATALPATSVTHRHRSPGSGIGLVGLRAMRLQQVVKDERRPREFDPREYISTWTEKDLLHGKIVDAWVIIFRTRGCYWARSSGCSMCGYVNDVAQEVSPADIGHQLDVV